MSQETQGIAWGTLRFIALPNPDPSRHLHLKKSINKIGRDARRVDIALDLAFISGLHCMIEISDSEEESKPYGVSVILRDFSRNGIFVNKKLVGKNNMVELHANDTISFTQPKLRVNDNTHPCTFKFQFCPDGFTEAARRTRCHPLGRAVDTSCRSVVSNLSPSSTTSSTTKRKRNDEIVIDGDADTVDKRPRTSMELHEDDVFKTMMKLRNNGELLRSKLKEAQEREEGLEAEKKEIVAVKLVVEKKLREAETQIVELKAAMSASVELQSTLKGQLEAVKKENATLSSTIKTVHEDHKRTLKEWKRKDDMAREKYDIVIKENTEWEAKCQSHEEAIMLHDVRFQSIQNNFTELSAAMRHVSDLTNAFGSRIESTSFCSTTEHSQSTESTPTDMTSAQELNGEVRPIKMQHQQQEQMEYDDEFPDPTQCEGTVGVCEDTQAQTLADDTEQQLGLTDETERLTDETEPQLGLTDDTERLTDETEIDISPAVPLLDQPTELPHPARHTTLPRPSFHNEADQSLDVLSTASMMIVEKRSSNNTENEEPQVSSHGSTTELQLSEEATLKDIVAKSQSTSSSAELEQSEESLGLHHF